MRPYALPDYCTHEPPSDLSAETLGSLSRVEFDDVTEVAGVKTMVRVMESILEERIEFLNSHSRSFRESWEAIRESQGFRILVGTPETMAEAIPSLKDGDMEGMAGTLCLWLDRERELLHRTLLIVVDVQTIHRENYQIGSGRDAFLIDVDTVLAHVVHGHLASLIVRGEYAGACGDPEVAGWILEQSVMERQNQVRGEVGVLPVEGNGLCTDSVRRPAWDTSEYDPMSRVDCTNPNHASLAEPDR